MTAFLKLIGTTTQVAPCAKLNVRLKVEGRGKDGLHLLSMINVLTSLRDDMTVTFTEGSNVTASCTASPELQAVQAGALAELNNAEGNLAVKAAKLFLDKFKIPLGVHIDILKRIPIGAGLGGGAADAGAVLRALTKSCKEIAIAEGKVAPEAFSAESIRLALAVGADVPFFYHGCFARVTGVGEKVDKFDARFLEDIKILILLPKRDGAIIGNSTKGVYDHLRAAHPDLPMKRDMKGEQYGEALRLNTAMEGYEPIPSKTIRASLWKQILPLVGNDLEPSAVAVNPVLGEVLARLRERPEFASGVTGSGSALFVLPRSMEWFKTQGYSLVMETLSSFDLHYIPAHLINVPEDA